MDEPPGKPLLIGIVGPCASGKSTLITGLSQRGYYCHHIAQEHSYTPAMWQIITKPDLLIYLHVSFHVSSARRKSNWHEGDYEEQLQRLAHAREHAQLIINTDDQTPAQVLRQVLNFIKNHST